MSKKSILEQALLQVQDLEEAVKANAKGILASTMKEEINQLVKESLSEQADEDEVELDVDMDMSADNDEVDMDMDIDSDDSDDMDMDFGMDSDETPIDLTDASDEEILKVFKAMGEDDGIIGIFCNHRQPLGDFCLLFFAQMCLLQGLVFLKNGQLKAAAFGLTSFG